MRLLLQKARPVLSFHQYKKGISGLLSSNMTSVSMTRGGRYQYDLNQKMDVAIHNHRVNGYGRHRWKSDAVATATPTTPIVVKPWGVTSNMIESNGDYRDEMWIEDHIGGPLYEYQKTLPILPVGTIDATIQKLVPTVLPLAKNEEEVQALQQSIYKFKEQADNLQERLQHHAATIGNTSSWLQQWWNTWCYLQVRDSVVINVSYFFHFCNDPTATTMVERAATIVTAVAQFRNQIVTGQFPAEQIGKGTNQKPLCSVAYKYMFHACRIPKLQQDSYRIFDPAMYHHVIVSVRGQFYKVPFIDPITNQPYSINMIEDALQKCIHNEATARARDELQLQLGWCTTSNRDKWANARSQFITVGGLEMEHALKELESGAVLICLDIDDVVVSRTEIAQMLLHGSTETGSGSGSNRWFDKSVQLIVSANGKAGLLGEHSMMDGMPVVQLAHHITKTTYADCCTKDTNTASSMNMNQQNIDVQPIFSSSLYSKIHSVAEPCIEIGKIEM
jgi:carnitine O-acetyltransferase